MTLKPSSEALFNLLELLDRRQEDTITGEEISHLNVGIGSYFLEDAISEGYFVEKSKGSGKFKITPKGVDLLNQMRLKKIIENFDKTSSKYSKILIWIAVLTLIATMINIALFIFQIL